MDAEYDYGVANGGGRRREAKKHAGSSPGVAEEALLDLAQLEELHEEAEKMKALGNKHMAAQEYTRAYNAYSAALQLSPVGPSSHVFLSNRAAALLSLKRYSAAATDARRAVALAPTFGKAHARLGQALYFLKDYDGAVSAYEDALYYEPDNPVTKTYLEKAQSKMERAARKARGEEVSVADSNTLMSATPQSVVTDHNRTNVVTSSYRGSTTPMQKAAMASISASVPNGGSPPPQTVSQQQLENSMYQDDDPDFEEALRIQQRANKYLSQKQYKAAIEEYTAALFLVPDDPSLSADLHLGRAHALNGSRRHERAVNDARLAIKLYTTPAAYSTLAKSLFYMKDFRGAVDAFATCQNLMPPGESLGMFDKAYLQKAEVALEEEEASLQKAGVLSKKLSPGSQPIPKLPPPRFVPREQAMSTTPNVPSMPKQWPKQSPRNSTSLKCGEEREVLFLSEALGIKLNRGSDGMVRVLSVTPHTATSPHVRKGKIEVGDVVREAAGVDMRRPITNIMWGDTVALIKMAPRPIILLVAPELSPVPPAVVEEQRKALKPSRASGDESVEDLLRRLDADNVAHREQNVAGHHHLDQSGAQITPADSLQEPAVATNAAFNEAQHGTTVSRPCVVQDRTEHESNDQEANRPAETGELATESTVRDLEEDVLQGNVVFTEPQVHALCGWDNLRWMAYSGTRRVLSCWKVHRCFNAEKKHLFWKQSETSYTPRLLAIYEVPSIILVLRRPSTTAELAELSDISAVEDASLLAASFWIAEHLVDPKVCKVELSTLSTPTMLPPEGADARRKSCFKFITPAGSILLSAVGIRGGTAENDDYYGDSISFRETVVAEKAVVGALCDAADVDMTLGDLAHDICWKHQLVQGTLHSHVLKSGPDVLEMALQRLKRHYAAPNRLPGRAFLDALNAGDENKRPPIYYACIHRLHASVEVLARAGASTAFVRDSDGFGLAHVCAANLDHRSLKSLLRSTDQGATILKQKDMQGRIPLYIALAGPGLTHNSRNPNELKSILNVLAADGPSLLESEVWPSPVAVLASSWQAAELEVVLDFLSVRAEVSRMSVAAEHQYPIHSALLALKKKGDSILAHLETITVLLERGFEPNERVEKATGTLRRYTGFSSFNIIALLASEELQQGNVNVNSALARAAVLLVLNGARVDIRSPPYARPRSKQPLDRRDESIDGGIRQFESFDVIMNKLGGKAAFDAASQRWLASRAVPAAVGANLLEIDDAMLPDGAYPGGSDARSCAICWCEFGTLLNRKHKCRITSRYVCGGCSSKRVTVGHKEYRISDGQYLVAAASNAGKFDTESGERSTRLAIRQARLASENSNRSALFGDVQRPTHNHNASDGVDDHGEALGIFGESMAETRNELLKRGEKLQSLDEKSAQMVDSSAAFTKMATDLRKKSEGGFFGW